MIVPPFLTFGDSAKRPVGSWLVTGYGKHHAHLPLSNLFSLRSTAIVRFGLVATTWANDARNVSWLLGLSTIVSEVLSSGIFSSDVVYKLELSCSSFSFPCVCNKTTMFSKASENFSKSSTLSECNGFMLRSFSIWLLFFLCVYFIDFFVDLSHLQK